MRRINGFPRGIQREILMIAAVPTLAVTAVLLGMVYRENRLDSEQAFNQQGQLLVGQLAASLTDALATGSLDQIPATVNATLGPAQTILQIPIRQVHVFDHQQRLLFSKDSVPESTGSRWFTAPIVALSTPLFADQPPITQSLGEVQVEISRAPLKTAFFRRMLIDISLVLAALIGALGLAYGMGRRLSGAIQEVAQAISRIKAGESMVYLTPTQANELGTLQEGVNLLGEAINTAKERLETELAKVRQEYQQTLDALHIQTQEARQANQAKSLFLARVSHEMRTPLYSIQGLAEQLLKSPLDADQQRTTQTLLTATHQLYQTLSEILEFIPLEKGHYASPMIPIDLWADIETVVAPLEPLVVQQGLFLEVIVDPNLPETVLGDARGFHTIVANLVSNALKFTEAGGIGIRLSMLPAAQARTGTLVVALQVSDTGIGIAETQLNMIFAPFEQVDSALDRRYGGVGLGLSLVKGYCDSMGGQIEVQSQLGQGTCFTVMLPFRHEGTFPQPRRPTSDLSSLQVLVVDPQASFGESVRCRLTSLGVEVTELPVSLPQLAATAPPTQPYDVLILRDGSQSAEIIADLKLTLAGWAHHWVDLDRDPRPPVRQRLQAQQVTVLWYGATRKTLQEALQRPIRQPLPAPSPATDETEPDRAWLAGRTILVAEDFDLNREIMTRQLRNYSLHCLEARDGEEAVTLATQGYPDLILMDIQMPVKDGITAILEMRQLPRMATCPIIGFTASADKATNHRVLEAGANAVLTKPVSEKALVTAVCTLLKQTDSLCPGSR